MDFINSIVSQLGVQPQQAQGLAGAMFGALQGQLKEPGAAEGFGKAIPELAQWQGAAKTMPEAPHGLLGGLAGMFGGGLGGVGKMLEGLNVRADKLPALGAIAQGFLQERLGGNAGLFGQVMGAAGPLFKLLGGGAPAVSPGAMAQKPDLPGGLFGRK